MYALSEKAHSIASGLKGPAVLFLRVGLQLRCQVSVLRVEVELQPVTCAHAVAGVVAVVAAVELDEQVWPVGAFGMIRAASGLAAVSVVRVGAVVLQSSATTLLAARVES